MCRATQQVIPADHNRALLSHAACSSSYHPLLQGKVLIAIMVVCWGRLQAAL